MKRESYESRTNWENDRNIPDLALFKTLCDELIITLNERWKVKEYQENIINIEYTNRKIKNRNNLIDLLFLTFGVLILMTAIAIFPSENS